MAPEMLSALLFNMAVLAFFAICMIAARYRNLKLEESISANMEPTT